MPPSPALGSACAPGTQLFQKHRNTEASLPGSATAWEFTLTHSAVSSFFEIWELAGLTGVCERTIPSEVFVASQPHLEVQALAACYLQRCPRG